MNFEIWAAHLMKQAKTLWDSGEYDYDRWRQIATCEHEHRIPMKWYQANGVLRVSLVCDKCADKIDYQVRKRDYPNNGNDLPELTQHIRDLVEKPHEWLREKYWEQYEAQKAEQEKGAVDWMESYREYLRSDKWKGKRAAVLKRDPICKACETRPSEQAHHLTYERVFDEPLFDLVGVCRPCHKKIHDK